MSRKISKFCYKCGALEEQKGPLIEGLCPDCFLEDNPIYKVPENLDLIICPSCSAYQMDGVWKDVEKDPVSEYIEAAKELVLSRLRVLQKDSLGLRYVDLDESESVDVSLEAEYSPQDTITVSLELYARFSESQEEPFVDREEVLVNIVKKTCDVCQKQASGYYEAILQIRGEKELSDEQMSEIFKKLEVEVFEKQNWSRDEFVSKIKRKHGGMDFYASSTELARELARYLKKEYDAETSESAELIGQTSDGREKYRVTVVARLPF